MHALVIVLLIPSLLLFTSKASELRKNERCRLFKIGQKLESDKIVNHEYGQVYCDILQPMLANPEKVRMLEIGFGCSMHSAPSDHHKWGTSARLWYQFFQKSIAGGLIYYAIDYFREGYTDMTRIQTCVNKFLSNHPNVANKIFLGDQSNATFLNEVVVETNGQFDIIIDDAAHVYKPMQISFHHLWPHVVPGGYYVMEDLQTQFGPDNYNNEILGWLDHKMSGKTNPAYQDDSWKAYTAKKGYVPQSAPPGDLESIMCGYEICVLKKKFLA